MVTTLAKVLALAPTDGALTEEIQAKLGEAWNHRLVAEIVAGGMVELAGDLETVLPDHDRATRLSVAQALMDLFGILGLTATVPQVVTVRIEKTPDQMTLRELLEYVNADLRRYDEAWRCIAGDMMVNEASFRSRGNWVIPNADGKGIDVELTLAYAAYLVQTGAYAQVQYEDRRPTTLMRALGITASKPRPLVHVLLW